MKKEFKLTLESFNKLENELEYLKTVREKEVAEQIKEARSFGDLSENSEYDEAKNEQGKLFSRIAELENIISNSVIITQDMYNNKEISPGCKILVEDLDDNIKETYYLVGSQEADPINKKISDESPFGQALLGKTINTIITVDAPLGKLKYKILKISM